jgi:hypothetical protein
MRSALFGCGFARLDLRSSAQKEKHIARTMASSAGSIYGSMDEIGRLKYSIEKMNLNNASPIFGVDKATDLGFAESVHHAKVSGW